MERHRKAVAALVDAQILNYRRRSSPIFIANQKSDRTQDFDAIDLEVAQLAIVELNGQRPGNQYASRLIRLRRSAKRDGARRLLDFHGDLRVLRYSKNFFGRWLDQNRTIHVNRQFNLLVHLRDVVRLQFRYDAAAAQRECRVSPRSGWLQQFN